MNEKTEVKKGNNEREKDWTQHMMLPKAKTSEEVDLWFKQTLTKMQQIQSNVNCLSKKHVGTRDLEYLIEIVQSAFHHTTLSLRELFRKTMEYEKNPFNICR